MKETLKSIDTIDEQILARSEMLFILMVNTLDEFEGTYAWRKVANIRQQTKRLKDSIERHCKEFYDSEELEIVNQATNGAIVFDELSYACLKSVTLPEKQQKEFSDGLEWLLERHRLKRD